jgi:UDP-N-acetylmuramoyl-tripeptide--D-alanyl-D-alanine ligase
MLEELYSQFLDASGVSTDTRKISPNQIYFALKGPSFDGNRFAGQALEKGARLVVVDNPDVVTHKDQYFLVQDVLQTLQLLANHHRHQFDIPFIGITGSNGKTTTKELVYAVLSKKFNTHYTKGNLNNHIGVPLTLLELTNDAEIAIIEMGANKIGDIRELCQIAEPNYGMITNIGRAHIEGFGSLEGVLRGKTELYQHLRQSEGQVFMNSSDKVLFNMAKRFEAPVLYPNPGDFLTIEKITEEETVTFKDEAGTTYKTQLTGSYNFDNVAAALCIGKYFEVNWEDCCEAVVRYQPQNNRSQVEDVNGVMVIKDAYNANPDSMTAALESLMYKTGKKAVILGDMNELGDTSVKEHQHLGHYLSQKSLEKVFLIGEKMSDAHEKCSDSVYFNNLEKAMDYFRNTSLKGYTILVKGSRSMQLEQLYPVLH